MKIPQTGTFNTATNTIADLQKFMAGVGDNAKIIAKRNDQDEVILFVKPGSSSLGARISGKADERRELARTAINEMITKAEAGIKGEIGQTKGGSIFDELRASISESSGRSLLSGELRTMATGLTLIQDLDAALLPPAKPQGFKFEGQIDPALQATTGLVMSVPGKGGGQVDLPTITVGGKTYEPVKHLTQGGFADIYLYRNTANHNEQVVLKAVPDLNIQPRNDKQKALQEKEHQIFEREIVKHVHVGGGDNAHPNVLKAEAGVRMPDGSPAILLGFAPGGNLADFSSGLKLSEGDGPGQCPKALADVIRSDMLGGVGAGFTHLDELDMAHNDIKGENILLDAEGNPLVSDFGEAASMVGGEDLNIRELRNQSEFNSSPELLRANLRLDGDKADSYSVFVEQLMEPVKKALGQLEVSKEMRESVAKALNKRLDAAVETTIESQTFVNGRDNDRWGLGALFAQVITGGTIMRGFSSFKSETVNAIIGRGPEDLAVGEPDDSGKLPKTALLPSSGNEAFDSLLNQQLSMDKTKRLTPQEALRQPAVRMPGVGGPDLRAFKALQIEMSGLRNEVAAAQKEIDKIIKGVGDRPMDPRNAGIIQGLRDDISKINVQIASLTPRYDAAKDRALTEIGLAQLDNAGRELGRARDEIVETQQQNRAIEQLGRDAIRLSDMAMALESGEPLIIRG
jgi:serine/threonine protein kinase